MQFDWGRASLKALTIRVQSCRTEIDQRVSKGAFTLARFRARFRTKLAHLEMKNIFFILQNVQA